MTATQTKQLILLLRLLAYLFGDDRVMRWLCRLSSHKWADEQRYGVEPVCVHCGTTRGE